MSKPPYPGVAHAYPGLPARILEVAYDVPAVFERLLGDRDVGARSLEAMAVHLCQCGVVLDDQDGHREQLPELRAGCGCAAQASTRSRALQVTRQRENV